MWLIRDCKLIHLEQAAFRDSLCSLHLFEMQRLECYLGFAKPLLDYSSKIKMLRRLGFSFTLVLDPLGNLKTYFSTIAIVFESRIWLSISVPRHGDCSGRSLSIHAVCWDP